MICLKPHTNKQQLYFMTIEKRPWAVVFKLRSAQPWSIMGHFQTFCSHISFIMKMVNITAFFFCVFLPSLVHNRRWVYFQCKPPNNKILFFTKYDILLLNKALWYKKCYCIFTAKTYTFNLHRLREISYLVTRFSQTTVLRSFLKSDIPLCFRIIS